MSAFGEILQESESMNYADVRIVKNWNFQNRWLKVSELIPENETYVWYINYGIMLVCRMDCKFMLIFTIDTIWSTF